MESIKKLEYFSLFLALGIIAAGSFLKSIPTALLFLSDSLYRAIFFISTKRTIWYRSISKRKLGR